MISRSIRLFVAGFASVGLAAAALSGEDWKLTETIFSNFAGFGVERGSTERASSAIAQELLESESGFEKEVKSPNQLELITDPAGRVSEEFKVPEEMRQRVGFWFEVYTKHSKFDHVIHHVRYPWIVFDVVKTKQEIDSGKGPYWLRVQRAEKRVAKRKAEIKKRLLELSRASLSDSAAIDESERQWLDTLKELKGSLKGHLKMASRSIRSQLGQREFFEQALEDSQQYMSLMEDEFTNLGLPIELSRIPFVESSFNVKAKSRVGASGIWQIMPRTGQSMGLVSAEVDERNSPIKATRMAARLLKQYYRSLNDWPLTVTSYNHGIGNIRKAIREAKSEHLPTIIENYHKGHFKFASANFFACVLAATHGYAYRDEIFGSSSPFELAESPKPRVHGSLFREYRLPRSQKLMGVAKNLGVSIEQLLDLNLDLPRSPKRASQIKLKKGFVLFVPSLISEST